MKLQRSETVGVTKNKLVIAFQSVGRKRKLDSRIAHRRVGLRALVLAERPLVLASFLSRIVFRARIARAHARRPEHLHDLQLVSLAARTAALLEQRFRAQRRRALGVSLPVLLHLPHHLRVRVVVPALIQPRARDGRHRQRHRRRRRRRRRRARWLHKPRTDRLRARARPRVGARRARGARGRRNDARRRRRARNL